MKIPVIQIGKSKGIRLPAIIIEKYKITDTVQLILEKEYFIVKPKKQPRKGWDKSFKRMHENGDDKLIIPTVFEDEKF